MAAKRFVFFALLIGVICTIQTTIVKAGENDNLEVAYEWRDNYAEDYGLETHNISIHKGYLYVFVGGSSFPGKVYRTQDLTKWEKYMDLEDYGYVKATFWPSEEFNNKLVIGGQVDGKGAIIIIDDKKIVQIPDSDEIMGMVVKDSTLFLGSWDKKAFQTEDLSTFKLACKLPDDAKGGAGNLAVYPGDNKLYIAESFALPAHISTASSWGKIYSWDGSKLAVAYRIPRGGAVQDSVALLKPYFSRSGMEPTYLYIGTTSGDIVRYDGAEWKVDITLDLPIVGLNSQEVGGTGNAGSGTLVVSTGYCRHQPAAPYLLYQQSGSIWISDAVSWWKIIDSPAISFARTKSFGGNLLVSTLYFQEGTYAAVYKIGPIQLQKLIGAAKVVRPQIHQTTQAKENRAEVFSVPQGRQLSIHSLWLSPNDNNTGYLEYYDGQNYVNLLISKNTLSISFPVPLKIPASARIYLRGERESEIVFGGISGELEKY